MLRQLRIWLALGGIALAAPASASISIAFQPIDFSGLSGSILLSSYVRRVDVLLLPGSVSLTSVYTPPQNIEVSRALGGRLEWRWDRFEISPADSYASSSSAFGRRTFHWTPGASSDLPHSSDAIPEPGAALLFAVGSAIVALRLRGARRPA